MFRGDAAHTGVYRTGGPAELGGVVWQYSTMGPVRSTPAVTGDMVYVGSTDGNLYALDRRNGEERWRVNVKSPVSSSPAVAQGIVVFGSRDGAFHAVDAQSGGLRWKFETGPLMAWEWGFEGWDIYTSSPVVVDSAVVFGAGDGVLYALDLASGGELWKFSTEGRIRSTPAIADGAVYVGSADGRAYALDLKTGREIWRHETDGVAIRSADQGVDRKSIISSPTVAGGTVYIGSRDGFMYALDQETGERKWQVSHDGSWAVSSPAVLDDTVFSGTSDGRFVHAIDVVTGEERWRYVGIGYTWSSPCLASNTVFIGDGAGYLIALDQESGAERWRYRVDDGVYSSPVVADGVVYFGADDGNVYALHGEGQLAHRAVFWDEVFKDYTFFRSHLETKIFFEQRGYQVLDADALREFMVARTDDREASVIVFAMDHVPATVAAEPADTTLFGRYLKSGGKVVWLGLPPMILQRDETGRPAAMGREWPTALLGVDHANVNFDFYAAMPTDLGRSWGLTRGWVSAYAMDVTDAIQVLAMDENEKAGAWLKSFGGVVGTGYINLGCDHATPASLDIIRTVAEYGIEQ
jgi:outer membrane protein assembly factor BamB